MQRCRHSNNRSETELSYADLTYNKSGTTSQKGERTDSLEDDGGKLALHEISSTVVDIHWTRNLNEKDRIMKPIKENVGAHLCDMDQKGLL